ncbi:MAG: heparinase II/III family protein, partial [Lentisphaeria bacterium]|nr:heparinase II/III family protein [Lentisphaeria bacterium]
DQGYSYWCVAACAALLGDTETLKSIVRMYEKMLAPDSWIFYGDGTFFEGTWAYESQFLAGSWSIPEVLVGNLEVGVYSNPNCTLWEKVLTWYLDSTFPDGTMPAVNDAHVGGRPALLWSEIAYARYGNRKALRHLKQVWGDKLESGSEYSLFFRDPDTAASPDPGEPYGVDSAHLADMGMMILRQGEAPSRRMMAFLDYGAYLPAVHKHRDYLNFGLWAHGMEMVSEIGYSHNPLWAKRFQVQPLAHNTVLEVAGQEGRGEPLVWCVTPGPKIAEAGNPPGNSRCILLLPGQSGAPVVVDIFRVGGNQEHFTWTMHARSADWQVKGVSELTSTVVPKPLRHGRRGQVAGDLEAIWTFPGKTPRGLAVRLPAMGASEVILAECPAEEDALQACHVGGGALKPGAVLPRRGHIQMIRPGPNAIFVAVYAPFEGKSIPDFKTKLHRLPGHDDAIALRIDRGTDSFVVLHSVQPGKIQFGATQLDGRICVVSLRNGMLASLCLGEGIYAEYDKATLVRDTIGNAYAERVGEKIKTLEMK